MGIRVCAEPGCPTITDQTRCPPHRAAREQQRGTRTARGYDNDYLRAATRAKRTAGSTCPRCNERFTADNPPTGGHIVAIRDGGSTHDGIEAQCRRCNLGWRRTGL